MQALVSLVLGAVVALALFRVRYAVRGVRLAVIGILLATAMAILLATIRTSLISL